TLRDEDLALGDRGWYADHHVRLRTGTPAIRVDVAGRAVWTGDGDVIGYDHLVLATGARARVPAIAGIAAGFPAVTAGVTVLRTIGDARRLANLAVTARRKHGRIAVLGGGVLGIEAARALAARGTEVTVLHRGGHPMDRQLDAPAGRVL